MKNKALSRKSSMTLFAVKLHESKNHLKMLYVHKKVSRKRCIAYGYSHNQVSPEMFLSFTLRAVKIITSLFICALQCSTDPNICLSVICFSNKCNFFHWIDGYVLRDMSEVAELSVCCELYGARSV